MATFGRFPRSGHSFTAVQVGEALAGLIHRDSNGAPIPGILGSPRVTAVPSSWNVRVHPFTHVAKVGAGGVAFSGVSAAENVAIDPPSMPAGQSRIDVVCWDSEAGQLVVAKGTPGTYPPPPSTGTLVTLADVKVLATDSMVVGSRIELGFEATRLAVEEAVSMMGEVSPRAVNPGSVTRVNVSFPPNTFDAPPFVMTSLTGDIRDVNVSVESRTEDGFVLVLGSNSHVRRTFGAIWRAGFF